MKRFWIVGTFFTLFVVSCFGTQALVHVNGKSGDAILQHKTDDEQSSSLYLYYSQPGNADVQHELKESQMADFLSFVVGGPNVDPKASRKEFPSLSSFNKAKANLMLVLPGITADLLSYPMMKFLAQPSLHSKYTIQSEFYPSDLAARFTTFNTGKSPAEHEIVARTWNTAHFGKTQAFKAHALPKAQSLGAALASAHDGKPIIFSGSADYSYASAFGVYPLDHQSASHFTYYYNNDNAQIENVIDGSVLLAKDDLIERITTRNWKTKEGDQTRFLPSRKEFIVHIADTKFVWKEPINGDDIKSIFNLNDNIDLWMFGEFEMAFTLIEKLKTDQDLKALAKDNIQDLFSFVFTGVRAVYDKYGPGSSHRLCALYLVDSVLYQLQRELSSIYGSELATELALVQFPAAAMMKADKPLIEKTYAAVKDLVGPREQFNEYFPMIYAKNDASAGQLCTALAPFKDTNNVHCYARDPQVFARLASEYQQVVTLTSDEVSTFQIVLWFSIILVIAVAVVVYSICFMNAKLDFVLDKGPNQGGAKPHSQ